MSVLDGFQAGVERFVLDPRYHDILSVFKGARNGAVYGTKIRFPHALVMVLLFRSGTLREKLTLVFRATKSHARNLATFVALYKATCLVLKYWGSTPGKEGRYDSLVAGVVGGYYVFGRRSPRTGRVSSVNQQICIYVFARVVLALARMAVEPHAGLPLVSVPETSSTIREYAWPVFAAGSWGMVMWLFRWHATELQSSLRNSMRYLYELSDEWDGLRTLVWHNT